MRYSVLAAVAAALVLGCAGAGKVAPPDPDQCVKLANVATSISGEVTGELTDSEKTLGKAERWLAIVRQMADIGCEFVPEHEPPQ